MKTIALVCAIAVCLAAAIALAGMQRAATDPHEADDEGSTMDSMGSMSSMPMNGMDMGSNDAGMSHMEMSMNRPMAAHMKMTDLRPPNAEDQKRADELVRELRAALEPYKDYHVAESDGFRPFLPNLNLAQYHFTNYRYGFAATFWFRPLKPTSLLYKKISDGYQLLGAMYTASRFAGEDKLNARVPLSVARWHQHINICLPPKAQYRTADWKRFGPAGSISTVAACKEAEGTFYPVMFGWMVHVYPFASSPDQIWAH